MFLGSLIHRKRLFELTTRWFAQRLEEGDGRFLGELFTYERLLLEPCISRLAVETLKAIAPADDGALPLRWRRLANKDLLRELLCADPRASTDEAARALCGGRARVQTYRGTPADLIVGEDPEGKTRALLRVKRLRRLSQKTGQLLTERLGARIREAARDLARQRAEAAGVPLDGFFTPPEAMATEFAEAERVVAQAIKDGAVTFAPEDLAIKDVLGLRLVADDDEQLAALEERLAATSSVRILPDAIRRPGWATLAVELALPAPAELAAPLAGLDWQPAASRGLPAEDLAAGLLPYVESGARDIEVQVQLVTLAALCEYELGPAQPEARIAEERNARSYRGHIAENATYVVEYLLMHALSPLNEVHALPFELSGRYLPDAVALAVGRLFDETPRTAQSFVLPWSEALSDAP